MDVCLDTYRLGFFWKIRKGRLSGKGVGWKKGKKQGTRKQSNGKKQRKLKKTEAGGRLKGKQREAMAADKGLARRKKKLGQEEIF